jgi:hypothetical protein
LLGVIAALLAAIVVLLGLALSAGWSAGGFARAALHDAASALAARAKEADSANATLASRRDRLATDAPNGFGAKLDRLIELNLLLADELLAANRNVATTEAAIARTLRRDAERRPQNDKPD